MSDARPAIAFSAPVFWVLARTLLAIGTIAAASRFHWWAGAGLIGCVWIDALAGWALKRSGKAKSSFAVACELPGDFVCFVWAPVAWVTSFGESPILWCACAAFVVAGGFRLARFQVEGLVKGGYRGLPVTYNGYLIPAVGALVHWLLPYPQWVWPLALLVLSAAMVSKRFVIPEF